jgi:prepilin-type N-terminal cleavage/methylation domain-containing protein/prepilin-type processing-associated H-X9-DG protein
MLRRNTKGFTLIELLVVVAIIGALIAILVPSLSKVRKRAKTLLCATNVRGLAQTYYVAVQRSGNLISNGGHGPQGAWDAQIIGLAQNMTPAEYYTSGKSAMDKFRFCPETDPNRRGGRSPGSAYLGWECNVGPGGGSSGSYEINNWIFPVPANPNPHPDGSKFYNLKRLINESVVPVFADGTWHDFSPRPSDGVAPNVNAPTTATETVGFNVSRGMADVAVNRHDKKVNVAYWDGHAEQVKLEDLWNINWYRGWTLPIGSVFFLRGAVDVCRC